MASRRPLRALAALVLVTVIWGWSFSWSKQVLLASERSLGPRGAVAAIGVYIFLRFGLAALLLLGLPAARRGWSAGVVRGGVLLGGVMLAGFVLQLYGLTDVSPAVSAFLTSLYVVFTALITAWRGTHRVSAALVAGIVLATFGAGFINGPPQLSFGIPEWLTVGCAFVFALHILLTDSVTRRVAAVPVTVAMFVSVVAGSIVVIAAGLARPDAPSAAAVVALAGSRAFLVPTVLAAVLGTVVAITMMNVYQRDLDPVRAAVLYALEPVWAAAIAIALGLADAGVWLWVGGAALLAGNLVAEAGAPGAAAPERGDTA